MERSLICKRVNVEGVLRCFDKLNYEHKKVEGLAKPSCMLYGILECLKLKKPVKFNKDVITERNPYSVYSSIDNVKHLMSVVDSVRYSLLNVKLSDTWCYDDKADGIVKSLVAGIRSDTVIIEPDDTFDNTQLMDDGHMWFNITEHCENILLGYHGVKSRLNRIRLDVLREINKLKINRCISINYDNMTNVDVIGRLFGYRSSYLDMLNADDDVINSMLVCSILFGDGSLRRATIGNIHTAINNGEAINISTPYGSITSDNVHLSVISAISLHSKDTPFAIASDIIPRLSRMLLLLRSIDITMDVLGTCILDIEIKINEEESDVIAKDVVTALNIIEDKGGM